MMRTINVTVEFVTDTHVPATVGLSTAQLSGTDSSRYQLTTVISRHSGEMDQWAKTVADVEYMIGSALEAVGIVNFDIVAIDMTLEPIAVKDAR